MNVLNWSGPGMYGWVADEFAGETVNRFCLCPAPAYTGQQRVWCDSESAARFWMNRE